MGDSIKRLACLAIVMSLLLGGCALRERQEAAVSSAPARRLVCIDGLEWIAFPREDGAAILPHFKPDGTVFACSDSIDKVEHRPPRQR